MLFDDPITSTICDCAFWADKLIRTDLIDKYIVSENDYTSNFTGALRREINSRNIPGLKAKIQVLDASTERATGTDACIILQNDTHFKISIFEAKWPRLSTHSDYWDYKQKSSGLSHFDSQIKRQKSHSHYAAIWEMFYSEFAFGLQSELFPNEGSACVWHSYASLASSSRPNPTAPWTDAELELLLMKQVLVEGKSLGISDMLREVCECRQGIALPIGNYKSAFEDRQMPHEALIINYSSKNRP
jgi:hypothetical protein